MRTCTPPPSYFKLHVLIRMAEAEVHEVKTESSRLNNFHPGLPTRLAWVIHEKLFQFRKFFFFPLSHYARQTNLCDTSIKSVFSFPWLDVLSVWKQELFQKAETRSTAHEMVCGRKKKFFLKSFSNTRSGATDWLRNRFGEPCSSWAQLQHIYFSWTLSSCRRPEEASLKISGPWNTKLTTMHSVLKSIMIDHVCVRKQNFSKALLYCVIFTAWLTPDGLFPFPRMTETHLVHACWNKTSSDTGWVGRSVDSLRLAWGCWKALATYHANTCCYGNTNKKYCTLINL